MKIIGIDLSGPRNVADTVLTAFDEQGDQLHFVETIHGADDSRILHTVSNFPKTETIVIGIDAPLSYNATGGDRPSDSELREAAVRALCRLQ